MDNEKIILLILGAIIGFVVSLVKDWLMEGKKQKEQEKQFKREKLEKAFMLLTDLDLKARNTELVQYSEGKYNSFELNMIIRFYFDNIHVEYKKYLDIVMKYSWDVKNGKISEVQEKEYSNEYTSMINLLVKESQKVF